MSASKMRRRYNNFKSDKTFKLNFYYIVGLEPSIRSGTIDESDSQRFIVKTRFYRLSKKEKFMTHTLFDFYLNVICNL